MNCARVKKNLSAFLDKELKEGAARRIEEHLEKCSLCRKETLNLSRAWELLKKREGMEVSPAFNARFWENVARRESEKGKVFFPSPLLRWSALAAVSVIILMVALLGKETKTGLREFERIAGVQLYPEYSLTANDLIDEIKDNAGTGEYVIGMVTTEMDQGLEMLTLAEKEPDIDSLLDELNDEELALLKSELIKAMEERKKVNGTSLMLAASGIG